MWRTDCRGQWNSAQAVHGSRHFGAILALTARALRGGKYNLGDLCCVRIVAVCFKFVARLLLACLCVQQVLYRRGGMEGVHLTSFGRQTNHQDVTIVNIHHIAFTRAPATLTANFYCYHEHYHLGAHPLYTAIGQTSCRKVTQRITSVPPRTFSVLHCSIS